MKRIAAVCLCVLSLFIIGTHAYAYPSKRTGDTAKLLEEIVRTSPVDVHKPIVLYDNINYRSDDSTDDLPVFDKGCACLVPAEIINVNLNMTYLFHSPALPPKDLLGSLIYANIELKNILEQYKEIQKRAVEIAEAAGSPAYVDSPYSIYMPLPEVIIHAAADRAKESETKIQTAVKIDKKQKIPLSTDSKRIENSITRVLSSAHSVMHVAKPQGQGPKEQIPAKTDIAASSSLQRNGTPEKFIDLASRTYNISHFNTGYSNTAGQHQISANEQYESQRDRETRRYADFSPEDMPWWISVPSQFITYCMNNKLEAGTMILVFIFFLNIFGSIFRR